MTTPRVSARPFEKKLHHEPFNVEVNGPAHTLMELQMALDLNRAPNLGHVKRYAEETMEYIKRLGRGELPMWHELAGPPVDPIQAAKDRQERQSKLHRKLVEIHAVRCDGDTLNTLDMLAEILEAKGVVL